MNQSFLIRGEDTIIATMAAAHELSQGFEIEAGKGVDLANYDCVGTLAINVGGAIRELTALQRRIEIWQNLARSERGDK